MSKPITVSLPPGTESFEVRGQGRHEIIWANSYTVNFDDCSVSFNGPTLSRTHGSGSALIQCSSWQTAVHELRDQLIPDAVINSIMNLVNTHQKLSR